MVGLLRGSIMSLIEEFHERVGHLVGGDVWNRDYAKLKITEKSRELSKKGSRRYRGSVRLSRGLFYTTEERKRLRDRLLSVKLP